MRLFARWFCRGTGLAVFGTVAGVTFQVMRAVRPEDGFLFGLFTLGCFAVSVGVVVGILALIVRDTRS